MRPIARVLAFLVVAGLLVLPGRAVADPVAVHVTTPGADALLRGSLQVRATAPHADSVTFQWSPNGTWKWTDIGTDTTAGDGWKAPWDTTAVKDGTRYVRARALAGADTSTSEKVSVTVDNTAPAIDMEISPAAFSPNGDRVKDRAFATVTLPEPARLEIDVVNAGGRTVRRMAKAVNVPAGTRRFEWNGVVFVDGHYRRALDGTFRIVATATDLAGNTGNAKGSVRVDTKAPGFEWRGVSPEPASGTGPVTFSFRTADRGTDIALTAAVWNDVRRVALTFDDCIFGDAWTSILNTLHSFGVKTTFFCNAVNLSRNEAQARRTVEEGHAIGSHTRDHPDLRGLAYDQIRSQVRDDIDAWWQIARTTPVPLFRPPYGAYDSEVLRAVGSLGFLRTMLWDVDPQDWSDPGPSVIVDRVLSHAHRGMVVVMHVKPQTASALPSILRGLASRGLHQVKLTEMFRAAGSAGLVEGPAYSGRITEHSPPTEAPTINVGCTALKLTASVGLVLVDPSGARPPTEKVSPF